MPLRYELDTTRHSLITIAQGDVRLADVLDHIAKERADQALGYPELVDARAATVQLSAADIRKIVGLLRQLSLEYKLGDTAVIVSSDVAYGMMRMMGILAEDFGHINVFRSAREGEAWLNRQGTS